MIQVLEQYILDSAYVLNSLHQGVVSAHEEPEREKRERQDEDEKRLQDPDVAPLLIGDMLAMFQRAHASRPKRPLHLEVATHSSGLIPLSGSLPRICLFNERKINLARDKVLSRSLILKNAKKEFRKK